jgi:hypothetical protein
MKYYRGTQFVPMKGTAAMYFETDDDGRVQRFVTVIPDTGEIEKMENPPIKRLYKPELLEVVDASQFDEVWSKESMGDR